MSMGKLLIAFGFLCLIFAWLLNSKHDEDRQSVTSVANVNGCEVFAVEAEKKGSSQTHRFYMTQCKNTQIEWTERNGKAVNTKRNITE